MINNLLRGASSEQVATNLYRKLASKTGKSGRIMLIDGDKMELYKPSSLSIDNLDEVTCTLVAAGKFNPSVAVVRNTQDVGLYANTLYNNKHFVVLIGG